jgi:hypothetical protein
VGISNAIALADETISNNDITISQLLRTKFHYGPKMDARKWNSRK